MSEKKRSEFSFLYTEEEKPIDYPDVIFSKVKHVASHHIDYIYFLLSLQFELKANNQKYYLHLFDCTAY